MSEQILFPTLKLPGHIKKYDVQAIAEIINSYTDTSATIRPRQRDPDVWIVDIKITEDSIEDTQAPEIS